jgi:hypothetical protein
MDIEEFYDADPRRRASAEIELGAAWQDSRGVLHELNYIEDTGELYVMSEPAPKEWEDPAGGVHLSNKGNTGKNLIVRVVATIDSVEKLHSILAGWEEAMSFGESLRWLEEKLSAAGVATAPAEGA